MHEPTNSRFQEQITMAKCNIPMSACGSSQIKEFGYDPSTQTLAVRFNGKSGEKTVYTYANVPKSIYEEMRRVSADPEQSVGKFFGQNIKGKTENFPFTKIVEDEDEAVA